MKRLLFTIFLSFGLVNLFAQQWAPIGTKWYYTDIDWGFPGGHYPHEIESTGDTVINGQACRIIQGYCECGFFGNKTFMYSDTNRIYLYNDSLNSFHVFYDFTKVQGETWTIVPPTPADSFKVLVDTIYTKVICGNSYTLQHIRNNDLGMILWEFYGDVVKGIGNITGCLFPVSAVCDPPSGSLRCFENSDTLIKFDTIPCDTIYYTWMSVKENLVESFFISPNPFTTSAQITLNQTYQTVALEVYDIQGKLLLQNRYAACKQIELKRGNLNEGLYFLKLTIDGNREETRKIIINE